MSLDLTQTALEIDQMAVELGARRDERDTRLRRAVELIGSFGTERYERKRLESAGLLKWSVPEFGDKPGDRHAPEAPPGDYCVAATDGSHIDVDRHLPARCFLINTGAAVITYGSRPDARLSSRPRLYARADELVIRDALSPFRQQPIEAAVLAAKRAVEEIRALAEVVRELPRDIPTLALMDGTLLMLGLVHYPDFVVRELIDEGFAKALDELAEIAEARTLALASYISLPRSSEVVNGLRLEACPFEPADCDRECGHRAADERPCEVAVGGVLDRYVYSELLRPGERSCLFTISSQPVKDHYRGHGLHFFYVNAGEEIGRVEVPSWVAEDEALVGLVHSILVDQCRLGPGYPIALMEAHEQAVVTGADRQYFVELVEDALYGQRLPVYSSEKSRSKRLRWL